MVAAPVAVSSSVEQQTGQKSITLRGREFISDVVVSFPGAGAGQSSLYSVNAKRISPTDSDLFSWLTGIAEKFDEYKFHGMAFTYEPQCTTNTTGCIGVYFDPDPTNTPPQSWSTFTNTGCNTHGAAWAKHQLVVPRSYYGDRKTYYCPDQYVDANGASGTNVIYSPATPVDPLEYYPGSVGVSTVGVLGTGGEYLTIGKIYLDYVITLQKATIDTVPRNAYAGVVSAGTVALTGKLVSPYCAQNSGTGMFMRVTGTSLTPIIGVSAQGVAGTVGNSSPFRWGDSLWNFAASLAGGGVTNALSGVTALQTQDLLYSVYLYGPTSGTIAWHFENKEGEVSTLSNYRQGYGGLQTDVDGGASTGIFACGTMHIHSGERISLVVNSGGGTVAVAESKIYISPFTWGLDV